MATKTTSQDQDPKKDDKIIENLLENLEQISDKYKVTQAKQEDQEDIHKSIIQIIKKISITEEISMEFATIGICALLQCGAYLKSVINRKITINSIDFTKKMLIYSAEQAGNKYTLRVIARHLKFLIAKISLQYGIPGHLYARFKIEHADLIASNTPEQNKTLATYCTDFQIENPATPSIVREFLANREKNRTPKK